MESGDLRAPVVFVENTRVGSIHDHHRMVYQVPIRGLSHAAALHRTQVGRTDKEPARDVQQSGVPAQRRIAARPRAAATALRREAHTLHAAASERGAPQESALG